MWKRIALQLLIISLLATPSLIAYGTPEAVPCQVSERDPISSLEKFSSRELSGSWSGQVVTEFFPPFDFLLTAGTGGGLVVSQAIIVPWPAPGGRAVFTPAHGQWLRNGKGRHTFVFVALIHDEYGILLATSRVSGTLQIDESGRSFSGTATAATLDTAGNVMYTFDAALNATRITVDP